MAERDDPERPTPRTERDFLSLWRQIAIGVDTILIAGTVMADNLGRLIINPDFHISDIMFGALITAWLVLLGFEAPNLVRGNGGRK